MDELSFEIGKNIRKYRKLKGLTLEKLAEVMGTDTNYLGQCERGERRFSLDKLVDLIEYFDITANDIISVPNMLEKKTKENNKKCLFCALKQDRHFFILCHFFIGYVKNCLSFTSLFLYFYNVCITMEKRIKAARSVRLWNFIIYLCC